MADDHIARALEAVKAALLRGDTVTINHGSGWGDPVAPPTPGRRGGRRRVLASLGGAIVPDEMQTAILEAFNVPPRVVHPFTEPVGRPRAEGGDYRAHYVQNANDGYLRLITPGSGWGPNRDSEIAALTDSLRSAEGKLAKAERERDSARARELVALQALSIAREKRTLLRRERRVLREQLDAAREVIELSVFVKLNATPEHKLGELRERASRLFASFGWDVPDA